MKKIYSVCLIFVVTILCSACVKETNMGSSTFRSAIRYGYFYMSVHQNGSPIADSIMADARLYFLDDGRKIYDTLVPGRFQIGPDSVSLIQDRDTFMYNESHFFQNVTPTEIWSLISVKSYATNINAWYLEFKNGDIDTLRIVTKNVSDEEGMYYPCQCHLPIIEFEYNGDPVAIVNGYKQTGVAVYVVDKK